MSNVGEQIQNRLQLSDSVVDAARTHADSVARALAKRAEEEEGPNVSMTAPAFEQLICFLAGGLEHAARSMREAERTLEVEQADDLAIRTVRDFSAAELNTLLARLRAAVDEHLGNEGLARYGLEEDTPRTPRKLVEYTRNVADLLKQHPVKVTSPFGSSLDTAAALSVIDPKAEALDKIVVDDDREWRELEDAYAKRNRSIEVWNEAYQGTALALEGLYRLAGFADLAAKVKPTLRRLRGDDAGAVAARAQEGSVSPGAGAGSSGGGSSGGGSQ